MNQYNILAENVFMDLLETKEISTITCRELPAISSIHQEFPQSVNRFLFRRSFLTSQRLPSHLLLLTQDALDVALGVTLGGGFALVVLLLTFTKAD